MKDLFDIPEIKQAATAAITAIITAATGMIIRRIEKSKLRKQGKLNDGRS